MQGIINNLSPFSKRESLVENHWSSTNKWGVAITAGGIALLAISILGLSLFAAGKVPDSLRLVTIIGGSATTVISGGLLIGGVIMVRRKDGIEKFINIMRDVSSNLQEEGNELDEELKVRRNIAPLSGIGLNNIARHLHQFVIDHEMELRTLAKDNRKLVKEGFKQILHKYDKKKFEARVLLGDAQSMLSDIKRSRPIRERNYASLDPLFQAVKDRKNDKVRELLAKQSSNIEFHYGLSLLQAYIKDREDADPEIKDREDADPELLKMILGYGGLKIVDEYCEIGWILTKLTKNSNPEEWNIFLTHLKTYPYSQEQMRVITKRILNSNLDFFSDCIERKVPLVFEYRQSPWEILYEKKRLDIMDQLHKSPLAPLQLLNPDDFYRSPLYQAIYKKDRAFIILLSNLGTDIGRIPFGEFYSLYDDHEFYVWLIELLGTKVSTIRDDDGTNLIQMIIYKIDRKNRELCLSDIQRLITLGVSITQQGGMFRESPFTLARQRRHYDVLQLFLEHLGRDPDNSPLHDAVLADDAKEVKRLLETGSYKYAENSLEHKPLDLVIQKNKRNLLPLFVPYCELNQFVFQKFPFFEALRLKHYEIARDIWDLNYSPAFKETQGCEELQNLDPEIYKQYQDIISREPALDTLFSACRSNDVERTMNILSKSPWLIVAQSRGFTPLTFALKKHSKETLQHLFQFLAKFLFSSSAEAEVHAMAWCAFRESSLSNESEVLKLWMDHPLRLSYLQRLILLYPKEIHHFREDERMKLFCQMIAKSELSCDQIFLFAPFIPLKLLREEIENVKRNKEAFPYLFKSFESDGVKVCLLTLIESYANVEGKNLVIEESDPLVMQDGDGIRDALHFQKFIKLRTMVGSEAVEYLRSLPLNELSEVLFLATEEQKKAYAASLTLFDFVDPKLRHLLGPLFGSKMQALLAVKDLSDEQQVAKFEAFREAWYKEKLTLDINFSKKKFFLQKVSDQISPYLPDPNLMLEVQTTMDRIRTNADTYQNQISVLSNELLLRELLLDPPLELTCEIGKELLSNPYVCKATGHQFDYLNIYAWVTKNQSCPITRAPRTMDDYEYSPALKAKVEQWKKEQLVKQAALRMKKLKVEMRQLLDKKDPESVKNKEKIVLEYHRALHEKFTNASGGNILRALAEKTTLSPGTKLYHCSSEKKVLALLSEGLEKAVLNSSAADFDHPEMGTGMYLSTEEPAYLSQGRDHVIVFEVVDEIEGYDTCGLEELLRNAEELGLTQDAVRSQYAAMQRKKAFLRQEGLPPKDSEIVMTRTESRIKIAGIATPPFYNNTLNFGTLEAYCLSKSIHPHSSWHAIEVIAEMPDHFKLKANSEEFFFKFMRKDPKRSRLHEICGARVAHTLLGDLIPKAGTFNFRGKKGITQRWVSMKSLAQSKEHPFDPTQLNDQQLQQFIAHWFVDRLIGNWDNHPNQFGIDEHGNIIAFDKGSSFKQYKASNLQFMEEKTDETFCAYEAIRRDLKAGKIKIDFDAPIIVNTLKKIKDLTLQEIADLVREVSLVSYPKNQQHFVQTIYANKETLALTKASL